MGWDNITASQRSLLLRRDAWLSERLHFAPLTQKERHRGWRGKARARFTQRKAKRNTLTGTPVPPALRNTNEHGRSKVINNIQCKKVVMFHTWQDLAECVTEPAYEMLSYQINSSWLGYEPCHIY